MGPVPGTSAAGQADGLAVAAVNAANCTHAMTLGLTAGGCHGLVARGSVREQTWGGGVPQQGALSLSQNNRKLLKS